MMKLLRDAVVSIASLLMLAVVGVFALVLIVPAVIFGLLTDLYLELVGIHNSLVRLLFKYRRKE